MFRRHKIARFHTHYIDVIMTTMASQITSLTVVYSIVYSIADQRTHQSSASLAFVRGIHRDRWIPRTKGELRGKCFHLMTSSWKLLSQNTSNTTAILLLTEIKSDFLETFNWVFNHPLTYVNVITSVSRHISYCLKCGNVRICHLRLNGKWSRQGFDSLRLWFHLTLSPLGCLTKCRVNIPLTLVQYLQ